MSQEDSAANGATNGSGSSRLRRPPLERSEPRRGWGNLYAPGKADASRGEAPSDAETAPAHAAPAGSASAGAADAAARVVRDGYRIVEENLRRGRQVAAELRGVRQVADFAGRIDSQRVVSNLAQTLIDPALTEQVLSVARSFMSVLGAVVATPSAAPTPAAAPAEARVPLHPQDRSDYSAAGARILKMRSVAPGEWLADLEIDGKVRRVQVRAVDGEL